MLFINISNTKSIKQKNASTPPLIPIGRQCQWFDGYHLGLKKQNSTTVHSFKIFFCNKIRIMQYILFSNLFFKYTIRCLFFQAFFLQNQTHIHLLIHTHLLIYTQLHVSSKYFLPLKNVLSHIFCSLFFSLNIADIHLCH